MEIKKERRYFDILEEHRNENLHRAKERKTNLVEIESNNTAPTEVSNEEEVCNGCASSTEGTFDDSIRKPNHEEKEGKDYGNTLPHNQLNWKCSQLLKDRKR